MTELPAPLTPKYCDLRDYAYIPLHVERLKQSRAWTMCKRNPALAFYLFNTWTAAFQSMPAASLENDDLVLADLAMCDDETWAKVKADVLRGWIVADDGRLYHPVVAEYALEGWLAKLSQRKATEAAAHRRDGDFDAKPFDAAMDEARSYLHKINPEARALKKRGKTSGLSLPRDVQADHRVDVQADVQADHRVDVQADVQVESRELRVSPSDKSSGESAQARPPAPDVSPPQETATILTLPAPPKRAKKPETTWPPDLAMSDTDRVFAEERGYRGSQATRLWEAFESRSIAKGLTYVDWHQAWRNYVLKQLEFDARSGRPAFAAAVRRRPDV